VAKVTIADVSMDIKEMEPIVRRKNRLDAMCSTTATGLPIASSILPKEVLLVCATPPEDLKETGTNVPQWEPVMSTLQFATQMLTAFPIQTVQAPAGVNQAIMEMDLSVRLPQGLRETSSLLHRE